MHARRDTPYVSALGLRPTSGAVLRKWRVVFSGVCGVFPIQKEFPERKSRFGDVSLATANRVYNSIFACTAPQLRRYRTESFAIGTNVDIFAFTTGPSECTVLIRHAIKIGPIPRFLFGLRSITLAISFRSDRNGRPSARAKHKYIRTLAGGGNG